MDGSTATATAPGAAGASSMDRRMKAARERALAADIAAVASGDIILWVSGARPSCRRCAFCCLSSSCDASYRCQYVNTTGGLAPVAASTVLDAAAINTAGGLASVLAAAPVNTNGAAETAGVAAAHAGASRA